MHLCIKEIRPVKPSTREEYQKRINKVTEYISNHIDCEMDLATLAGISNLSPFHFHRIMKAFLGETMGAYITRMRVEAAARLLRYTELPIREVAFSVGYEIPSSLTKAFNQMYSISPSEYRNNKNLTIMKKAEKTKDVKIKFMKIADLPEKRAIYCTVTGEYGNPEYATAWSRLWSVVKEQKLYSAGIEHLGISYDDPKVTESSKCRYDACLVIHKPAKPVGEVGVKDIPGGRFAIFQYVGPYNGLGAVYDKIFGEWLPENGHELRNAPCMEKYINNPKSTEPHKLKTEIYLPVL